MRHQRHELAPSRLTSDDVAIYVHLVGAEDARQLGATPFYGCEAVGKLRVDGDLGAETVVVGDEVVAAGLEAGEEPGEGREVVPSCPAAAVGVGNEGGGGGGEAGQRRKERWLPVGVVKVWVVKPKGAKRRSEEEGVDSVAIVEGSRLVMRIAVLV